MVWPWVLGVIVLLIALLCWTRVGALIALGDETAVDVKVGLFHFQVVPGREKAPKKKKPRKAKPEAEEEGEERPRSKPTLEDIRDGLTTLLPPLKRALRRTRRGIRVNPMCLALTLGGQEDPAATAKLYGEINAGIWAGMPTLERLLDIPDPRIHTEVDFQAERTRVEGTLGVTIRIGTLLAVGFGIAIPALRWFLRFTKRHRKTKQPLPAPEKSGAGAA